MSSQTKGVDQLEKSSIVIIYKFYPILFLLILLLFFYPGQQFLENHVPDVPQEEIQKLQWLGKYTKRLVSSDTKQTQNEFVLPINRNPEPIKKARISAV
jgi:hypothetical protein